MSLITCIAPVNIAVIKYWGKRDQELLLPTNGSLSVTLSTEDMHSKTSVKFSTGNEDEVWLNGKKQEMNKRFKNVLSKFKQLRKEEEALNNLPKISGKYILVESENNFPTAAGLASSASGFACLAFSLAKFYALPLNDTEISKIARIGSGSACRSIFGGFVAWEMGSMKDGSDSYAVQIAPETHWPEMEALILVVSDVKKHTSSTSGMQTTIETSELVAQRINHSVKQRLHDMITAIQTKNFDSFAELTMKDSNQFHAVCLDTFPPIFYLTDISRKIINFIHVYNKVTSDGINLYKAAYTFDAGPNAVIYTLKKDIDQLMKFINFFFPPPEDNELKNYYRGSFGSDFTLSEKEQSIALEITKLGINRNSGSLLNGIIKTKVGEGPKVIVE
ncbi:diphosphomevalonate decarboxylase, partial [Clydaea vesicula]